MKIKIISSLTGLFLVSLASAGYTVELGLSANALHFDYTEFSTSDTVLDRETGWLPGFSLSVSDSLHNRLHYEFIFAVYDGNVDYDGMTQSGIPHTTITDAEISYSGFRLLAPYNNLSSNTTDVYVGGRHYEWKRDIRDNNGVFGLYEVYKWWEISAGIQSIPWSNQKQKLTYDIGLLYLYDPTIFIDLNRFGRGTARLNIGEKFGGRLRLGWEQAYDQQWSLKLNGYFEFWDFGRSNTGRTSGGIVTGVTEPRSETRNTGIQLSLHYAFP